ncbi:MAG TPA: RDD family protein [Thermoanaerobaculia bacterium]|nr:RDD family protein [Thermoanaerobaculia bacterium]
MIAGQPGGSEDGGMGLLDPGVVLGIDNVALELPLASAGSRALAGLIDYLVLLLGLSVVLVAVALGLAALELETGWAVAVISILYFLIQWLYFFLFEWGTGGRTPGKMAVRLRVVGAQGGTPSAGALLVRTLLRPIDLLVGLLMIALDERARRLGDRLAGTQVVHAPRPSDAWVLGRPPAAWTGREIELVESLLRRAPQMHPDVADELARRFIALALADQPERALERSTATDALSTLKGILAAGQAWTTVAS